jgi:hypothetical protein
LQRGIDCRRRLGANAAAVGKVIRRRRLIMAYRQSKPETRAAIITYLKGLN